LALQSNMGFVLTRTGQLSEAQRIIERVLELTRDDADIEVRGFTHSAYSEWACVVGDARLAASHVRQALDIAERIGSARSRMAAYSDLGAVKILEGQWRQAVEALETALALAREKRSRRPYEASVMADLAEAYLGLGDLGRARATASEAVAVGRRRRTRFHECLGHLALARVLLRAEGAGASGEIDTALDAARALVEETGAMSYLPFIHVELAELARLANDDATRQRELREAHRLFTEMGAPIRAEQVARELGA